MGTFYRDAVARFGFEQEAAQIHSLWQSGQRRDAVQAVTNFMISQLAIAGSAHDCRKQLDEFRKAGADMPVIVLPHGAPHDVFLKTLEALA
jgi:alkanesulfonate monooxygenase SsuD/methylene tetrahydromethanopterin reductase-like flavin-dependent oxidoreductase (luciferase family)